MTDHTPLHDDPEITMTSSDVADAWLDRGVTAAMLHGIANHYQNRMLAADGTGTWPGMAQQIRDSHLKGMSAQAGQTTVRTFLMAGRLLVTLSRGDQQISFLGYERDDNGWWGAAIQSLEAPLSVALAMIDDVAAGPVTLTADEQITIEIGPCRVLPIR